MAGSPMGVAPVANLGFPSGGGGYDVNTEQGWLQTYYPNHEWLQPGGKYGPTPGFSGNPTASSPSTGQFDISTEKGWLQTYYPNHPDLQPTGKYGGSVAQGLGYGGSSPGSMNFNNVVGMGSSPRMTDIDFSLGLPPGQMSNIDFGLGLPPAQTPITGMTEEQWERAFMPNAPDLQPGGKYGGILSPQALQNNYVNSGGIVPGTGAALAGGMTAEDAAAQAYVYDALQARLASEAAWYTAQQTALPSSPQNYASRIVAPYDRNFGGQIQGYNPFSTQYQAY